MTADLAISGTTTDTFVNVECSVTLANPVQYVAWWMLTLPVETVYVTNVQIYYREFSEYFLIYYLVVGLFVSLFLLVCL